MELATFSVSELFDIFDADGNPVGTASREEAHKKGLWHRASNMFVFFPDGQLLLQQRHLTKDVCPGAWDVSAAEHLQPGESFERGALRGLQEELGIQGVVVEPLGSVVKYQLDMPEIGVRDYEFQQSFRVEYDGPISPEPREVRATRKVWLADLQLEMQQQPETFTPWFRQRLWAFGMFQANV